jgi:hypothetical protein
MLRGDIKQYPEVSEQDEQDGEFEHGDKTRENTREKGLVSAEVSTVGFLKGFRLLTTQTA